MNQSEILLQELVDLKKKEMRQKQTSRTLHFLFVTLPIFITLVFSIYAGYSFLQKAEQLLENIPSGFEGFSGEDGNNFFDSIRDQLP